MFIKQNWDNDILEWYTFSLTVKICLLNHFEKQSNK